jgi:hypothetical protein
MSGHRALRSALNSFVLVVAGLAALGIIREPALRKILLGFDRKDKLLATLTTN